MKACSIVICFFVLCVFQISYAVNHEDFAILHNDQQTISKELLVKKVLFLSGQINGVYQGLNDLVAALHLVENLDSVEMLSGQLLAVKIGLIEKPAILRHIAREIKTCENYPGFPLGFADSAEGPEPISDEFFKIADHIENLKINYQLSELKALRKEAQRVVFELFWTDSEKMRTLAMDMISFLRVKLKENIPFDIFGKVPQIPVVANTGD